MYTIYKYNINDRSTRLEIPSGGQILKVGLQNNKVVLWVKVDTDYTIVGRLFELYNTGETMPGLAERYIGTVQFPSGVTQHLFEIT